MTVTAYYGLFRVGQIAESQHALKYDDVCKGRKKDKILFILRSSKCHRWGNPPQCVKISAIEEKEAWWWTDTKVYCLYHIVKEYWKLRGEPIYEDENFFVFGDHRPVKGDNFWGTLRRMLELIGLDSSIYDTHSFCIGHATDLYRMGTLVETIKQIGRWRSNSVYKYLKES